MVIPLTISNALTGIVVVLLFKATLSSGLDFEKTDTLNQGFRSKSLIEHTERLGTLSTLLGN